MDDRAGYPALRALMVLEVRRTVPALGRGLVFFSVLAGVLVATGAYTLPRLAFLCGVMGMVPSMSLPLNVLRDKLDGGMEFLRFLPVSPDTHALARLAVVLVMAVPGAVLCTAGLVLSLVDDLPGVFDARAVVGVFALVVVALAGMGFLLTAILLRFDMSQVGYAPLAILGVVLVLDEIEERVIPDPLATLTQLMAHAWFLPAVYCLAVAAAVGAAFLAFRLASTGIARFTPPRDRMTW